MKVWIVQEYPHGHEDDIHKICFVTADRNVALPFNADGVNFFAEEWEVRNAEHFMEEVGEANGGVDKQDAERAARTE